MGGGGRTSRRAAARGLIVGISLLSAAALQTAPSAASGTTPLFRSATSADTGLDHLYSLTITVPTTTGNGDLLLLFFESSNAADPTGLAGWTKVDSGDAGSSLRGQSYFRVASNEPSTYTLTYATAIHIGAVMLDYQGVDTSAPISSHGVVSNDVDTTTLTSPALSGVGSNDLSIIAYHARGVPSGTFTLTPPSGWTERAQQTTTSPNNPDVGASIVELVGPGGTPSETASMNITYVTTALSLRPSSAPPTDAPPVARLSVTPSSGPAPLAVTADASGSSDTDATPIVSYTFSFGDGSTAVGPQPGASASHTYTAAGTYTVTVTVTDSGGLSSTASVQAQATSAPTNLVGNPGFETGTQGWSAVGSGITLARVSAAYSGSWAAQVLNAGSGSTTADLNDTPNWVTTTAPGTYTISAWVRSASSSNPQLTLKVQETAGSKKAGSVQSKITLSSTWKQISVTYVATAPGNSTLDLDLFVQRLAAQQVFYVDDVSITLA